MTYLNNIEAPINNLFNFLRVEYGFNGPFKWNCAYEMEYTFIKDKYYVNIGYDGAFFVSIGMTNQLIPELSTGEMVLGEIDYKDRKSFDMFQLLTKSELAHLSENVDAVYQLSYLAKTIKNNPEILSGNWEKLTPKYKMKRKISALFNKITNT